MARKTKRTVSKKVLAKRKIKQARPVHKRILLHPVSILVLLCAGVFIAGWTIRSFADSLTVSVTVEAPAPTDPATITSPDDQTHFTTTPVTISGVCEQNTYVELYQNGNFSGVANCGANVTSYQISTELSLGANELYTRTFSITDNEGPQSAHITVFYDQPSPPPPVIPSPIPGTLQVTSQDDKTYLPGSIAVVSLYPTISGVAPPYSKVTVIIHSDVVTCITYADANGFWSCTLDQPLPPGLHTVSITAVTPSGQVLHLPTYYIRVVASAKSLQTVTGPAAPFLIKSNYRYQLYTSGQNVSLNLSLSGGASPYAVSVLWGDGSQTAVLRKDQSAFTVSHAYRPLGSQLKNYVIKVQAVDANGAKALLQLSAVVQGNQSGVLSGTCIVSAKTCGNSGSSWLSRTKQWIWVIWPAYAVVVLMVLSFWLGERQELLVILNRQRPKHR